MASEPTDGELPEDVDAWLDERAESLGVDRDAVLRRLVAAFRAVENGGEVPPDATALSERLDRLESDYRENLRDVRKRVLQVKRATEAKAPADHDHAPDDRLVDLEEEVAALSDRVDTLAAETDRLDREEPVDAARLEEVESKLTRLARAVVRLQRTDADANDGAPDSRDEEASPPRMDAERRERLRRLKRLAAREDYRRATCEACGESASVALLPEPACPACGTEIHDIVPEGSFRAPPTMVGPEVDEE